MDKLVPLASSPQKKMRDPRLDFFRGFTMLIIFIAHMPDNSWFLWIPARFGFSSGAELFVFCSGFASAMAFGSVFVQRGFWLGTLRILHRIWQVYFVHICLCLAMIGVSLWGQKLTGIDYTGKLGLQYFFAQPQEALLRLLSLRFMPNYLDILPMYIVVLALIPLVCFLAKVSPKLVGLFCFGLWLFVQITGYNFSGGAEATGLWFFNPLAWQLMFFTGFAFARGWLPAPQLKQGQLFWLCALFLLLSIPLNFWYFTDHVAFLAQWRAAIFPSTNQTHEHILRYLHFLAFAYVVLVLIEPYRAKLTQAHILMTIGRQSLAAFVASLLAAWCGGMLLDQWGRGLMSTILVNLLGIGLIYLTARVVSYVKSAPWAKAS